MVPSFYIKIDETKNLQGFSLKHRIIKGIFSVVGKMNLFGSRRKESLVRRLNV